MVFYLGIGNCGYIVCIFCFFVWKKCVICKFIWKMLCFDKLLRMNYYFLLFFFREWYEYLLVIGWYVYCGFDEFVYDFFVRCIIVLVIGEVFDGK